MIKLFSEMTKEEKIAFFLSCQKLLVDHHPNSPFIFNYKNYKDKLLYAKDLISSYKGLCYQGEHVIALFNRIIVRDPLDPIRAIKENMFQPPNPRYNAVGIDFVVFRRLEDCSEFCRSVYVPQMEYVIYVKNNHPKIYKTPELLTQLLHLPTFSSALRI
jgi:hypothetical protein